MICPSCGKENEEGNLFCAKCGASLKGNKNGKENKVKTKRFKKKTIFFIIIAIFVVLGICYSKYSNNQDQYNNYVNTFNQTYLSINTEGIAVQTMCSQISDTWHGAIFNSSEDFNTAIQNLNTKWENDGSLNSRKQAKENIDANMAKLKNPPKDYEESYKLLMNLYDDYNNLYQQATTPTGTLVSYNESVTSKTSDFSSLLDKLKVTIPNKQ